MHTCQRLCVAFLVVVFASNVRSIYPDGYMHPSLYSWFRNLGAPMAGRSGTTGMRPAAATRQGKLPNTIQRYPGDLLNLLVQGQSPGIHQGQLQGHNQLQGAGAIRQSQGFGSRQGQGQSLGSRQGQGQSFGGSQSQGQNMGGRPGQGKTQQVLRQDSQRPRRTQGLGMTRSNNNNNSMYSRFMMMRRAMRPRYYPGQYIQPFGMFPGGTVISADGSDATVIDKYGMERSFDSGRLVA